MKILSPRIAPIIALILLLFSMLSAPGPASATSANFTAAPQPGQWKTFATGTAVAINSPSTTGPASATSANSPASPSSAPSSDSLRFNLNAKPPAQCARPAYGTIAARAPDGALCLCHQGYAGKPGFWEQIGTAQPCWPDQK